MHKSIFGRQGIPNKIAGIGVIGPRGGSLRGDFRNALEGFRSGEQGHGLGGDGLSAIPRGGHDPAQSAGGAAEDPSESAPSEPSA